MYVSQQVPVKRFPGRVRERKEGKKGRGREKGKGREERREGRMQGGENEERKKEW